MKTKLKPCPFCGGKAKFISWPIGELLKTGEYERWQGRIECQKCHIETLEHIRDRQYRLHIDVEKVWNRRAKA